MEQIVYTVLGDSISVGYTPFLTQAMGKRFLFVPKTSGKEAFEDLDIPKGTNCGDSRMLLDYLTAAARDWKLTSTLYLVNAGLHDVKTDPQTRVRQVSNDEYRKNLESALDLLKAENKLVIFINTTNAAEEIHNVRESKFYRYHRDVEAVNEIAAEVCLSRDIPMIDLYRYTIQFGNDAFLDHVHYLPEISEKQGGYIASQVKELLKGQNDPAL